LRTPIPNSRRNLFQELKNNLKENLSDQQFVAAQNNLMTLEQINSLAKEIMKED
jgi:hypothetical protein